MRRTRKPAGPPDLRVLEDKCQVMVHRIEGLLQYAIEHPLTCATEYDCRPFQDAIPVIKLIRIFLNKLSRPTNNRPHPLAGMSPDNLLTIIRSTGKNIGKFLHRMKEIHPSGAMIGSGSKVFDLVYSLQRPINIVKLHLSQPGHSESPQGRTVNEDRLAPAKKNAESKQGIRQFWTDARVPSRVLETCGTNMIPRSRVLKTPRTLGLSLLMEGPRGEFSATTYIRPFYPA
ncbi:hypothetical protein PtA15_5A893 [Puccinia triticina]|uniref:Uncharacterized protein n=1 Tax=Puccinia triticina TaxID=208348 RepID=A0ABY7CLV9_9BASI|nr:uncharacterized protein PtA15_5A893 [Puccinia triticina]WAQ85318.1 hypothetical protein PtA15_5A893 [Puccinia triticina]